MAMPASSIPMGPIILPTLLNVLVIGAGKAGAQQITLVIYPGLHGGNDVILHKFIGQVFDVQLGCV